MAMKDFVVAVHARAGEVGGAGGLTKRAQMLLELVVDVKNNRWAVGGVLGADGWSWVGVHRRGTDGCLWAGGWVDGWMDGWLGRSAA